MYSPNSEYWAFISYAREDSDPYLKRFEKKLRDILKVRTGRNEQSVNFFDRKSINPGEEWSDALSRALQSARVLICLYTPRYFQSEYCGKEVQVFRSRIDAYLKDAPPSTSRPPLIVPVLWVPESDIQQVLPQSMSGIQYKHDDFGELYSAKGVHALMMRRDYKSAFDQFLDSLADRLIQAGKNHRLQPYPSAPSIKEVRNAFKEAWAGPGATGQTKPRESSGPRFVQFIFVAGSREELARIRKGIHFYGNSGDEWQPYLPEVQEQIKFLTGKVVMGEGLFPEIIDLDENILERVEDAERENNILVIVVDTWTLQLDDYQPFLCEYDKRDVINCVVLIPWNPNDPESIDSRETLKNAIYTTFERKSINKNSHSFYEWIGSPEDLKRDLSIALIKARARILEKSSRLREAKKPGMVIPKPIVEGPGGRASDAG